MRTLAVAVIGAVATRATNRARDRNRTRDSGGVVDVAVDVDVTESEVRIRIRFGGRCGYYLRRYVCFATMARVTAAANGYSSGHGFTATDPLLRAPTPPDAPKNTRAISDIFPAE